MKKFVFFLMAFYFQPTGAALFLEPGRLIEPVGTL